MNKHNQQVALVTGGNRGIGQEIVRQLAARGITTVLGARQQAAGEKAAHGMTGSVVVRQLDVTDEQSVTRGIAAILAEFGRLDILVNNGAILIDEEAKASTVDLTLARQTLETNLFGVWRLCQAVVPIMQRQSYGRIVNLSSGSGSLTELTAGTGHWPAYSLSKTSLNALTVLLARELTGQNILVNAVCPGWVRTDMGGPGATRSVEHGAETPVWLATLPVGGPTGRFFRDKQEIAW